MLVVLAVGAPAAGADAPRWYGVGGQALPFATDEELLEFLDSAPVVEREDAGRGIGGVQKITLERDGVALHAGHNPGRPASHGCIRLPSGFAKKLYSVTQLGTPVYIGA